jgi:ketosteroid isomerase-like protein
MSQEGPEIFRALVDAWNRRDMAAVGELMADDVEWVEVTGRPERSSTGRDSIRTSLASLFDVWQDYRLELEGTWQAGDRMVAVVREVARGRVSGAEVEGRWGYITTVRDGRIARVEAYRDPQRALKAAGVE